MPMLAPPLALKPFRFAENVPITPLYLQSWPKVFDHTGVYLSLIFPASPFSMLIHTVLVGRGNPFWDHGLGGRFHLTLCEKNNLIMIEIINLKNKGMNRAKKRGPMILCPDWRLNPGKVSGLPTMQFFINIENGEQGKSLTKTPEE